MHRRGQNRIIEWKGRYVRLLFRRYRTGTRITRTLFAIMCGNAVLDSWMLLQAEVSPNLRPHCRLPGGGQTPGRSPTGAMLPQRPTGRAHPSHEISHLGAGCPHESICTGFPAAKQAESRLATAIGCTTRKWRIRIRRMSLPGGVRRRSNLREGQGLRSGGFATILSPPPAIHPDGRGRFRLKVGLPSIILASVLRVPGRRIHRSAEPATR